MIWDEQAQAFAEAKIPMVYDPESDAFAETTGLVWDAEAQAWTEAWSPNSALYLYSPGNMHEDVTGGYTQGSIFNADISNTSYYLNVYKSNCMGGTFGAVTVNAIDLTEYKTMYYKGTGDALNSDGDRITGSIFISNDNSGNGWAYNSHSRYKITKEVLITVDISDITGKYHVGISQGSMDNGYVRLYELWLE